MTSDSVQHVLDKLFTVAGVKRIISIDDMYAERAPIEEVIGLCDTLGAEVAGSIFTNYGVSFEDPDVRNQQLRDLWLKVNHAEQKDLLTELRAKADVEDDVDKGAKESLGIHLGKFGLQALSLAQWQEKKSELLGNAGLSKTLILFDEDFSKEQGGKEEGIRLVKEVIASTKQDEVLCALLSHKYPLEGIQQHWQALCEAQKLDKSRVVLIPKALLDEDEADLIGFARLIKLAILNGSAERLKERAAKIIETAHGNALKALDDIDIYDFDYIVFRSSAREGVWEPDTLFRIFGLFLRNETRKTAKEDVDLYRIAGEVRPVSQVVTDSKTSPPLRTWQVQRLELYESSDYLNPFYMPIEVGDIFKKTGDSNKHYILLAQPCDLMVRADGKRHYAMHEAVMAEIVEKVPKDLGSHGELPYFDDKTASRWFVSFKKTFSIRLYSLDLCAFNSDGCSKFALGTACPGTVIPTWKVRHSHLMKETEEILGKYEELAKKGMPTQMASSIALRCSNEKFLTGTVDHGSKTVSYNLQRVGRLRQPRASALLARYAGFMARQAFDHDFGELVLDDVEELTVPVKTVLDKAVVIEAEK